MHLLITYKSSRGKAPAPHSVVLNGDRLGAVTGDSAGAVSRLVGFTPKSRFDYSAIILASDVARGVIDLGSLSGWRANFVDARTDRPFAFTAPIEKVEILP